MLFLFGLFCFSGNILSTADGTKFVNVTITHNPVSNKEMEGAAILIVGQDGKILSVGELRRENQTLQSSDDNLMQRAIPTQQWSNEQIQPVRIEIFGTHSCPWCTLAEAKAHEIFDKQNVSIGVYKIDDQKRGEEYRKLSQDILDAAGSNLQTVPRISIIDTAGKRWFIGGYDIFEKFIRSNRNGPAASQTANATQPSSAMNYAFMNIPTTKWTGAPIQPIQIEIFGADYCPPCKASKALAIQTFGYDNVKFYDIIKSKPYLEVSNNILSAVRWIDSRMPRISVICKGSTGIERLFVGGYDQLRSLINSMNGSNARSRAQRQSSNLSLQSGQTNLYNIFRPIQQLQQHGRIFLDNAQARYRGLR